MNIVFEAQKGKPRSYGLDECDGCMELAWNLQKTRAALIRVSELATMTMPDDTTSDPASEDDLRNALHEIATLATIAALEKTT